MTPEIIKLPAMKFAGIKENFNPQTGDFSGIGKAWERLFQLEKGSIKHEVENDQFWAVTSDFDKTPHTYLAGGLVTEFDPEQTHISNFECKEQQFAMFEHRGNANTMGSTISKAFEWIESSEYKLAGTFNLEMYDSRCDPAQPDNYVIELYFPIA